jgi:hypothetical protein
MILFVQVQYKKPCVTYVMAGAVRILMTRKWGIILLRYDCDESKET